MQLIPFLIGAFAITGFVPTVLAAGTPPPTSKHWGLECNEPAVRDGATGCKRFLVQCDGRHADWRPSVTTQCHERCHCAEHGGTPPPPYGKDHPPQIPPIRPVSPLNMNSKSSPKSRRPKRDVYELYNLYQRAAEAEAEADFDLYERDTDFDMFERDIFYDNE